MSFLLNFVSNEKTALCNISITVHHYLQIICDIHYNIIKLHFYYNNVNKGTVYELIFLNYFNHGDYVLFVYRNPFYFIVNCLSCHTLAFKPTTE